MTKALRAPRLLKTAPVSAEQIPTHRESEDNQWVAAPLAALPEKAREWVKK